MKMVALFEICSFYSGTGFPIKYQGKSQGQYPFYKVGDISKTVASGSIYLGTADNYIDYNTVKLIKGQIVPKYTVVFAKIGEAVKLNRRAITSCDCLIDNNVTGIKPNIDILNLNYFYHFLCHIKLERLAEATTVPSIKKSTLEKIEIPLISLTEQKQISAILDRIAFLISLRRKQLEKLDELVKSRFIEMFGNENYPHVKLIDLITAGTGLSYGIVQPGDDGTGDMGVLRPVDLVNGKVSIDSIKYIERSIGDGYKKTELNGDELLITVRGTTGITALTDKRFKGMNVTRGIAVIRYDRRKVNPVYLNVYFNTEESQRYIKEHTRGATLQQINLSDLRIQQIMVPPLTLQTQFADFVTQIDKSKLAVQKSLEQLETLKKSLMQKYFG